MSAYKIDRLGAPDPCRQRCLGDSLGLSFFSKLVSWRVSRPDTSYFFSKFRREGASDFSLLAQRKVTKRKGAPVTRLFPPRQHAFVGRLVRASLRGQASIGLPVRLPESARWRGGAGEGGGRAPSARRAAPDIALVDFRKRVLDFMRLPCSVTPVRALRDRHQVYFLFSSRSDHDHQIR